MNSPDPLGPSHNHSNPSRQILLFFLVTPKIVNDCLHLVTGAVLLYLYDTITGDTGAGIRVAVGCGRYRNRFYITLTKAGGNFMDHGYMRCKKTES